MLRMFIALILENFEYDEDEKINIQIQLYQRSQIDMNELIDGRAREMSLQEQFKRLLKQNLDERCLRAPALARAGTRVCSRNAQSCPRITHFNISNPSASPFPSSSLLRSWAFTLAGH